MILGIGIRRSDTNSQGSSLSAREKTLVFNDTCLCLAQKLANIWCLLTASLLLNIPLQDHSDVCLVDAPSPSMASIRVEILAKLLKKEIPGMHNCFNGAFVQ